VAPEDKNEKKRFGTDSGSVIIGGKELRPEEGEKKVRGARQKEAENWVVRKEKETAGTHPKRTTNIREKNLRQEGKITGRGRGGK